MKIMGDCRKCPAFNCSVFNSIDAEVVFSELCESLQSISYKKGQILYYENTLAKSVFCIQEGKVKTYKNGEGRNLVCQLVGNSDILGYKPLFFDGFYSNTAKCLEDSQICVIPKKVFLEILNTNPVTAKRLLEESSKQNIIMENILRDLKCKNMLSRISGALITAGEKFGLDEDMVINVVLMRKDIAEIAGTTTASAIRILNELNREGTISLLGNRIKIKELKKLQKYYQQL